MTGRFGLGAATASIGIAALLLAAVPAGAATRVDPYKNFKFIVQWDGIATPTQVSKVTPLTRHTQLIPYRAGSDLTNAPRKLTGVTRYDPITLERGLTQDRSFSDWADQAATQGATAARRNGAILLLDDSNNPVLTFRLTNCWPSAYEALSDLDADAASVAVERLTLTCESWERGTTP